MSEYWRKFFNEESVVASSGNLQLNVGRTKEGRPVAPEVWLRTIEHIRSTLCINNSSTVLELCCGNGVIIGELSKYSKLGVGVDYSQNLLNQLHQNFNNVKTYCEDANNFEISEQFDAIIVYFAIQHFSEKDTYLLISKILNRLNKNGRALIGDIPDIDKKWNYVGKKEYHVDYFTRLIEDRPKIGHWFKREFFLAMESCFDGFKFSIMEQPDYQINSDYRFDLLIEKL